MSTRTLCCSSLALVIGLGGCGLFDAGDDTDSQSVTLTGTVAIPDAPTDVIILNQSTSYAYTWQSCPESGNDSALNASAGSFLLESTNNCAGAQFVYFYRDQPVNLEEYSEGYITFKVQINNAGQGLQLLIQDNSSVASNSVDLASYGYSSTDVAVDQLVSVPVTAMVTDTFNLGAVSRAFQLMVSCPSVSCYTTVSDIRWTNSGGGSPAPRLGAAAALRAVAGYIPMAAAGQRRWPRCEPRACQSVPRARVGIVSPGRTGWTAEPVETTTTDSSGEYSLTVSLELLQGGGPFYLAATSVDGAFTLLAPIPGDLIQGGASIELGIDRTTTAASFMTCPNGMTIPSDGSGGWCIGDPVSTSDLDPLYDSIDLSLTVSVSVEIEVIIEDATDSPAVIESLNQILKAQGLPDVTPQDLIDAARDAVLPNIDTPSYSQPDDDDTGTGTTDGEYTASQCSTYISCEVCSISACVAAASQTSCEAGYKTSDGAYFQCTSCEDCYSAAQEATYHCCPTPQ